MRHAIGIVCGLGASALLFSLAGCTDKGEEPTPGADMAAPALPPANVLPAFIKGSVVAHVYDGTSDDLLTGGFGQTGLPAAAPMPRPSSTLVSPWLVTVWMPSL